MGASRVPAPLALLACATGRSGSAKRNSLAAAAAPLFDITPLIHQFRSPIGTKSPEINGTSIFVSRARQNCAQSTPARKSPFLTGAYAPNYKRQLSTTCSESSHTQRTHEKKKATSVDGKSKTYQQDGLPRVRASPFVLRRVAFHCW